MDLIERYVVEVGRRLPKGRRKDVEIELRSLLQDMVEDRAGVQVDEADEEVVVNVLREMGPPQKVAASYQPQADYLVGPQLFPVFKIAFTAAAVVMAIVFLVGAFLGVDYTEPFLLDLFWSLVSTVPGYVQGLITAFAAIVIILAVIERFVPEARVDLGSDEDWDPKELPSLTAGKGVDRFGAIVTIIVNAIVLLVLNFYPQWLGLIYSIDGQTLAIPLLSENFYVNLLPWIIASLVATIIYNGILLYRGRTTRVVRLVGIIVELISAAALYALIRGTPVFGINEALIAEQGWAVSESMMSAAGALANMLNLITRFAFPIAFIVTLISATINTIRLIFDRVETPTITFPKAG